MKKTAGFPSGESVLVGRPAPQDTNAANCVTVCTAPDDHGDGGNEN